jgi:predicted nucleic acid-binding protein
MAWLLDTNVLSELRRPKPSPAVLAFFATYPLKDFYTSVVSLAEIRFGIDLVSDGNKKAQLFTWLDQQIRPMFASRILALDEETLVRWRQLVEEGRKIGHTFPQPDLLIAATALQHKLTVVTRDKGGYAKTGVRLLDPWKTNRTSRQ